MASLRSKAKSKKAKGKMVRPTGVLRLSAEWKSRSLQPATRDPQLLFNQAILYCGVIWVCKMATRSGNQKRQPETAIEAVTGSGKKQEMKKIFHGGGD